MSFTAYLVTISNPRTVPYFRRSSDFLRSTFVNYGLCLRKDSTCAILCSDVFILILAISSFSMSGQIFFFAQQEMTIILLKYTCPSYSFLHFEQTKMWCICTTLCFFESKSVCHLFLDTRNRGGINLFFVRLIQYSSYRESTGRKNGRNTTSWKSKVSNQAKRTCQ